MKASNGTTAANKAWATRRRQAEELHQKRSAAAHKAWKTIRANTAKAVC